MFHELPGHGFKRGLVTKCTLAVNERESKLALVWLSRHDRLKTPFLWVWLSGAAMSVTTFEGVVENEQIRLAADVSLPEKAKVFVIIPTEKIIP